MAEPEYTIEEEEEELDIFPDRIEIKPLSELIKQENILTNKTLIGGSLIGGLKISAGTENKCFKFEPDKGLWMGHSSFDSAIFSVNINDGLLITSKIKLTGLQSGSVVSGEYIDALNVGKLATGTISSKAITLAVADGTGDSYIAGGNNLDLTNWRGGDANAGAFILGLDDSETGNPAKFFAGNFSTSKYMKWTGSALQVVNMQNIRTFTAGEAIASGRIVCLSSKTIDTADVTGDAYIDEKNADTNYGDGDYIILKRYSEVAGGQRTHALFKFDTIPNYYPLEVVFHYYVKTLTGTGNSAKLYFISESWNETDPGGVTYNTKPTLFSGFDSGNLSQDYISIDLQSNGTGWQEEDITEYIKEIWEEGNHDSFYGIYLECTSSVWSDYCSIYSREYGGGDYGAYIEYTIAKSDNKIYLADEDDYYRLRNIIGVSIEAISQDSSGMVQTSGEVTGITYIGDAVLGNPIYIEDNGLTTTNERYSQICKDKHSVQVGLAIALETFSLDIKKSTPFLIETKSIGIDAGSSKYFYMVPWARTAIYKFSKGGEKRGQIRIERYGLNQADWTDSGVDQADIRLDWQESAFNSKITFTTSAGIAVNGTLYIYE